jgi:class 3 adenylate cyclase
VIGDRTNTASRLEAMTKETPHMVLVADATKAMLTREIPDLVAVDTREVRGRQAAVRLWSIGGFQAEPAAVGRGTSGLSGSSSGPSNRS